MKINMAQFVNFKSEYPEYIIGEDADMKNIDLQMLKYDNIPQKSSSNILAGLVAAASVGAAGVAVVKNKTAKEELKKVTEKLLAKDKKIKEAEEKAKQAVEDAEKKIKEAEKNNKTKEKRVVTTVYVKDKADQEEIRILKNINSDLSEGLRKAAAYIEKLGHELNRLNPKQNENKIYPHKDVNGKKDNIFRRIYKKVCINIEFFKFNRRVKKGIQNPEKEPKMPLENPYYKPKQLSDTEKTISWDDAQNINNPKVDDSQVVESIKPKKNGFWAYMEGIVAKGIDSICNTIRNA